jgi:hypothetical protein
MHPPRRFGRAILAAALCAAACQGSTKTYTLYRSSVLDAAMRLHVASFDSADGEAYNRENCEVARSLFQQQPGATVKYWCEKGRFQK